MKTVLSIVLVLFVGCSHNQTDNPLDKSTDLAGDKRLMWETEAIGSGQASTHRAQAAAKRVFNTIELAGLSREEVIAQLGDPKTTNDSIYNFPFYPAAEQTLVYRFDTGSYGWQFNVHFAEDGIVSRVEHLGIE